LLVLGILETCNVHCSLVWEKETAFDLYVNAS
jgi:hypothetical protein